MVALKHGLPLIQNEQGVAVTFENDWLRAALDRAARRAGYDTWWLLDEFSSAVSQYLRQDYYATVIELPSLDRVVRATLRDIGYREIAAKFRTVNPFQSVSLIDCVRGSVGNREALFFRRLSERIIAMHAARVQHFHFHDLHPCARRLLTEDDPCHWLGQPLMRARIVGFIRERVQALDWPQRMRCPLS